MSDDRWRCPNDDDQDGICGCPSCRRRGKFVQPWKVRELVLDALETWRDWHDDKKVETRYLTTRQIHNLLVTLQFVPHSWVTIGQIRAACGRLAAESPTISGPLIDGTRAYRLGPYWKERTSAPYGDEMVYAAGV